MFNLNTASVALRKAVKSKYGICSGKWEPVSGNINRGQAPDIPVDRVVAKVYNRNYPDGVQVTQSDIDYAEMYL